MGCINQSMKYWRIPICCDWNISRKVVIFSRFFFSSTPCIMFQVKPIRSQVKLTWRDVQIYSDSQIINVAESGASLSSPSFFSMSDAFDLIPHNEYLKNRFVRCGYYYQQPRPLLTHRPWRDRGVQREDQKKTKHLHLKSEVRASYRAESSRQRDVKTERRFEILRCYTATYWHM